LEISNTEETSLYKCESQHNNKMISTNCSYSHKTDTHPMAEAEHQDINTHIDQNPCQLAQICPSTFEKQEPNNLWQFLEIHDLWGTKNSEIQTCDP